MAAGRIVLAFGAPDPAFLARLAARAAPAARAGASRSGGMRSAAPTTAKASTREIVERRLGALGVVPEQGGQRGLFGRGLRDVWLAQGGGRIEGVRGRSRSRVVVLPGRRRRALRVRPRARRRRDRSAMRRALGVDAQRVACHGAVAGRAAAAGGRLRSAGGRPGAAAAGARGPGARVVARAAGPRRPSSSSTRRRSPTRSGRSSSTTRSSSAPRCAARIVVRRAARADPAQRRRARPAAAGWSSGPGAPRTRRRSAGLEARPGARHLYGEVLLRGDRAAAARGARVAAAAARRQGRPQRAQRAPPARAAPVRGDRRVLRPIVAAEERRAGAHLVRAGTAIRARDEVGLRALNDALRSRVRRARAGRLRPRRRADRAAAASRSAPSRRSALRAGSRAAAPAASRRVAPMRFKQSPVRLHPGEQRTVSLLFDPARIPPGTPIEVATDPGLRSALRATRYPRRSRAAGRA